MRLRMSLERDTIIDRFCTKQDKTLFRQSIVIELATGNVLGYQWRQPFKLVRHTLSEKHQITRFERN